MGLLTFSINVTLDGCVDPVLLGSGKLAAELDRPDRIDEHILLVHPRLAGHL